MTIDVDGSSRAARLQERQDPTKAHDKQTSNDKENEQLGLSAFFELSLMLDSSFLLIYSFILFSVI